jgi:hypothetical protein
VSSDNKPVRGADIKTEQGPMAVVELDRRMSPDLLVELLCCVGITLRFPVKNLEDLSYTAAKELKTFGYEVEE